MKYFILLLIYLSCLYSNNIQIDDNSYSKLDFIEGKIFEHPQYSIELENITKFPTEEIIKRDSIFCTNKYYFINFISPYICNDCIKYNMQFMNHLADIYPVQIIILVENWNIRDVHLKLKKYELNSNIQIFLDNEGKNILKLSSLDDIFINFGFMIIDNELNIYYLQLGSFEYPYSNSKLENIFDIANRFLQLK